ncbi:MAG: acylneuraminate cytidylyltransferase family protein [Alkalimonas sp.]|nr:acylneuraminate cytidylyltransferase family protein [Alkalimonas sp.]
MNFTAFIPARGGSKGIPDKNIREIGGKPLICWSIEQALASEYINRVIVSTDSEQIAGIARGAGAEVPGLRPPELAQDSSTTEAAMLHAVKHWMKHSSDEVMVLLQPTSPLRLPDSIDHSIRQFLDEQADSLVSVCESHAFFWKSGSPPEALYNYKNRPRRQDIQPDDKWYRENGSIYLTKTDILQKYNNRLGGRISLFHMQEQESWEIDSLTDLHIVSVLIQESGL